MRIYKLVALLVLTISMIASPAYADRRNDPRIAPIESKPYGKSYRDWAASWWTWLLTTPASVNPSASDANCGQGQSGQVWFLFGSFGGPNPTTHQCTVPQGKALFFPLINSFYGAFLNDPPETRTVAYLRAQNACIKDASITNVRIDGRAVDDPKEYLEVSRIFDVQLPTDNIFGLTTNEVPELRLSPSADAGFYLFLFPLRPGTHTIQWQADACGNFHQDITYNLTVQ